MGPDGAAPRHRQRDLPGVQVAYDVMGDGPGVVLIHGWACSRSDWRDVAPDLARDHRVLALDLPWHGESTASRRRWSMDDLGALVDAVVADEGMRGAVLVGHSLGAAVAVEAVLAGAGHRVVSLDGLTFMHMYPRQRAHDADAYLEPFRRDFRRAMADLCARAAGPGCDPVLMETVATGMGAVDPDAAIALMEQLMLWDMDAALGRAEALGLDLTTFAARSMLSPSAWDVYGRRLRITTVDLGGHFFPLQQPAATAGLIRGAVAGVTPSGGSPDPAPG